MKRNLQRRPFRGRSLLVMATEWRKAFSTSRRWEISQTNEGLIATGPDVDAPVEVKEAND